MENYSIEENIVRTTQQEKDQEAIAQMVQKTADSYRGDGEALLGLLRTLEKLHRDIRDDLFQETLPKTRHELYALLRDIESSGGWPYIGRMRLQTLLTHLLEADESKHSPEQ